MSGNLEFIVDSKIANSHRDYYQGRPSVSSLSNGTYVIAWDDESKQGGDISGRAVKAQIFSAQGEKIGSEFLVNSGTQNSQHDPIITEITGGGFLISWTDYSKRGLDTNFHAVRSQRFNSNGEKLGYEFLVNHTTSGSQYLLAAEELGTDQVLIVYTSGAMSSHPPLLARIYNANNETLGPEVQLNNASDIAIMEANRVFTISEQVTYDFETFNSSYGTEFFTDQPGIEYISAIILTEYDSSTFEILSSSLIRAVNNGNGFHKLSDPAISALPDEKLTVVWSERIGPQYENNTRTVEGVIFDSKTQKVISNLSLHPGEDTVSIRPEITTNSHGNIFVIWQGYRYDGGNEADIIARVFDSDGLPLTSELIAHGLKVGEQSYPAFDVLDENNAVVAWSDYSQNGPDYDTSVRFSQIKFSDIKGQIFSITSDIAWRGISSENFLDATYSFKWPNGEQDTIAFPESGSELISREIEKGSAVTIEIDRNVDDKAFDAITSNDALQALRIGVGLSKSDGTLHWSDFIAADINKDGQVNSNDALNILKLAVGLTGGPSPDWVFVNDSYEFSEMNAKNSNFTEGFTSENVLSDTRFDLLGILVGDVNGSFIA